MQELYGDRVFCDRNGKLQTMDRTIIPFQNLGPLEFEGFLTGSKNLIAVDAPLRVTEDYEARINYIQTGIKISLWRFM